MNTAVNILLLIFGAIVVQNTFEDWKAITDKEDGRPRATWATIPLFVLLPLVIAKLWLWGVVPGWLAATLVLLIYTVAHQLWKEWAARENNEAWRKLGN